MNIPLRLVYFGTSDFAVPTLEQLVMDRRFEVVAVVSQPSRPVGRKAELLPPPVAAVAARLGLPLHQPEKLRGNDELRKIIASYETDFFVVAAYGRILPADWLALPRRGCLNLHGSILPSYRGASPIQSAILNSEPTTGVTLMAMDEQMDHGGTYATVETPISETDTSMTLSTRLAALAATLLTDNLEKIAAGELQSAPQNETAATFCSIIAKEDGFAGWRHESATHLEHKLRAFTPWPGLFFLWRRDNHLTRVKILEAATLPDLSGEPGLVFVSPNDLPAVYASTGALELRMLQLEGKSAARGQDFSNGYRDFVGSRLEMELPIPVSK